MVKLALCDDCEQQRTAIANLLKQYAAKRPGLRFNLSAFASGLELLLDDDPAGYDLYLLDVVMEDLSGIDLGIRLKEMGCPGAIIYLTVSPEYAVSAYEARAFHYLLKPIVPERLFHVLDRALKETEQQKSACITVKTHDAVQRLRLDDIVFAELANRIVRYHLSGDERVDSVTLRRSFQEEMEPLLSSSGFVSCGASFVVNLHYVTAVEKRFLRLDNGTRIPLPRNIAAQMKQAWTDYWLDSSREAML